MRSVCTALLVLTCAGAALPAPSSAQGMPPRSAPQQAAGEVRGTVVTAEGQPIATASVSIHSGPNNQLVTGALTGADGSFRIVGLRPGRYTVRVSALGFAPVTRADVALTPQSLEVALGRIQLAVSAVQIEGVSVTGERSPVVLAPDRNTYRVAEMPAASGGTAVDVLRNVPSIEVDGDNKVSLRGAENVVVQINGRPTPMRGEQLGNFLAQLPANMVDRVEVIPNPSAKYDPEGMAGIINIALKENTDLGLSGGFTLGGGSRGRVNTSGNLGYQAGPLTLFGNYGFMRDNRQSTGFNNRENRYLDPVTYLESDIVGAMRPLSHSFNGSAEYRLGRRDVLSTNVIVSKRDFERDNLNLYRELDASRTLTGRYDRLSEGSNDDLLLDWALAYKHTVQPRANELSVEARVNRSSGENTNLFTSRLLLPDGMPANDRPELERNSTDGVTQNWTLQADWTRTLRERLKLEAGYKGTLRQLDNDFNVERFSYERSAYLNDAARSNAFDYDEQVHAAYGVLSGSAGSFQWQGGLRAEQALTRFDLTTTRESFDNDYRSLFPSALVAYNVDDARQLKLSYSKRVTRPDTRQLNPFGLYDDPLNLFRGNPYLKPEYTHAFEAGYQQSFGGGSLQVTPFFRHTVDAVRFIRTVDDAGVATTTFENVATSDSYGADVNASLRLGRVSGFGGFSAFKQVTDGSNLASDLSNEAFGWSVRTNATWRVTNTLDLQGMLMYRAPMDVEQGRIRSMTMSNVALRHRVNSRTNLTLRVMDPLNRMGFGSTTVNDRLYQEMQRKFGARGVFLGLNYSFGQQPRIRQERPTEQVEQPTDPNIPIR